MKPMLLAAIKRPGESTREQAEAILSVIEPHAAFEDEVFKTLLPDRWTSHVLGEHPEIVAALKAATKGDAASLRDAADLSLGHFDEEERFVLPRLEGA